MLYGLVVFFVCFGALGFGCLVVNFSVVGIRL